MPTHAEKQIVPYRPDQLFELVVDVAKYPRFLPWCVAARVRSSTERELVADLTIGFGPFRETFTSRVTLDPPQRVKVRYETGPFRYLNNHWEFERVPGGCRIDFFVDFEFKSRVLQKVIEMLFGEAVRRMVAAFETRAHQLYGAPAGNAGKAAV